MGLETVTNLETSIHFLHAKIKLCNIVGKTVPFPSRFEAVCAEQKDHHSAWASIDSSLPAQFPLSVLTILDNSHCLEENFTKDDLNQKTKGIWLLFHWISSAISFFPFDDLFDSIITHIHVLSEIKDTLHSKYVLWTCV